MPDMSDGRILNPEQQAAASHYTGPALTLAGPGSGKTTVLTERTLYLARRTCAPDRILSVTFTNAAGEEMRSRYQKAAAQFLPELRETDAPTFQTVHSFCNGLLRSYEMLAGIRRRRIEGEKDEKTELLRQIYFEINGEAAEAYILNQITRGQDGGEAEIKNIKRIRAAYERYKREHGLIDFDDMIVLAAEILHSDGPLQRQIREAYQDRFLFIQADEAQDLTETQFEVLRIVAAPKRNLFVVADDDQSIYGFRGASPGCLRAFYKSQPDCRLYRLSRNYRSVQNLVRISERFISFNTDRFEKKPYSKKEPGALPRIRACGGSLMQIKFLRKEIAALKRREPELTVGILYRNNISGLLISAFLTKTGIAHDLQGGLPETHSIPYVDEVLKELRNAERMCGRILPRPAGTFRRLLENGLERQFEAYCRQTRQHLRYKDAVLSFLLYLCSVCYSYREAVSLLDKLDARSSSGKEAICLSTVHSAKGLEYDAVFVIDAVMGEFPGNGAVTGKLLEEERRLFYVALTRARKYFYVTYPLTRGISASPGTGEQESIFVSELRTCLRALSQRLLT